MSKNNIYQLYVANVISPRFDNTYGPPYFQGPFVLALLNPSRAVVASIVDTWQVMLSATQNIINVTAYSNLFVNFPETTGLIRYVRISSLNVTNPYIMDPYMIEIDLEEDIVLDNDVFIIALNQGALSFSGDFA